MKKKEIFEAVQLVQELGETFTKLNSFWLENKDPEVEELLNMWYPFKECFNELTNGVINDWVYNTRELSSCYENSNFEISEIIELLTKVPEQARNLYFRKCEVEEFEANKNKFTMYLDVNNGMTPTIVATYEKGTDDFIEFSCGIPKDMLPE